MTTQPVHATETPQSGYEELVFLTGMTDHTPLARALRGLGRSTLSLRAGKDEANHVLREIVLALAIDEVGHEPLHDDYPQTEEGDVDYAEAVSRWLDAIEQVADEKTPLISAVLNATAEVVASRTRS